MIKEQLYHAMIAFESVEELVPPLAPAYPNNTCDCCLSDGPEQVQCSTCVSVSV